MSINNSTITGLYIAFYGRPADPAGMKFWSQQLINSNGNVDAIKAAFANSTEAQVRFGSDTATERITQIYQQLFDREPEPAGLAFWLDVVSKGHASIADVAIELLNAAAGSDGALVELRKQAADKFTTEVEASGSGYAGFAAVSAARLLIQAVSARASDDDITALVKASKELADVATASPDVSEALGDTDAVLELFDTAAGRADPVVLLETLAETARSANGDAQALAALVKGGGMANILSVLPEGTTLKDLVGQLGKGGLPALLKTLFPDGVPAAPAKPGKGGKGEDDAETMALGLQLASEPSKVVLEAITGIAVADGLSLQDVSSGAAQVTAVDYTGAGLAANGPVLSFDGSLAAGLYEMSWKADTFTVEGGHLPAGSSVFAGGYDGGVAHDGFAVVTTTTVSADLTRAAEEAVNEAFIGVATATVSIATGGGHDVISDQGGTVTVVYDRFDSTASDLVLGFDTGNDKIALQGDAAVAVDANADGTIQWAVDKMITTATEAASVTVNGTIVLGSSAGLQTTLATLNAAMDVSTVAVNSDLLILAQNDSGGAALFYYLNKDGNGKMDAPELTEVAMFAHGTPNQSDIVLIGIEAAAI